jgi:hypothetical protein
MTLTASSCFFWKIAEACGASPSATRQRDRATAAHDLDRQLQRREAIDPLVLHDLLGDLAGQQPGDCLEDLRPAGPVGLHADGVDDGVGFVAQQVLDRDGRFLLVLAELIEVDVGTVPAGRLERRSLTPVVALSPARSPPRPASGDAARFATAGFHRFAVG